MFVFHIAFALSLLSLTAGIGLYIWGRRNMGAGTGLAKLFGFLIMLAALITSVCTAYCGVKRCNSGCPVSAVEAITVTPEVSAPVSGVATPAPAAK